MQDKDAASARRMSELAKLSPEALRYVAGLEHDRDRYRSERNAARRRAKRLADASTEFRSKVEDIADRANMMADILHEGGTYSVDLAEAGKGLRDLLDGTGDAHDEMTRD